VTQNVELRKLALPALTRGQQSSLEVNSEARTLEFAFSSETPVERWFGDEVLSHDPGTADLTRLNDAAPLLWNHDANQMIGVVESARIGTDKRGYATVRFGTSPMAEQVLNDVRAGIIRNVSFGYRINEMVEAVRDGKPTYTATSWSPLEVSLVSIPADQSVGIGRSETEDSRDVVVRGNAPQKHKEIEVMTEAAAAPVVDMSAVRAEAAYAERARIDTINAFGKRFKNADLARQLIEGGRSLDDAKTAFMEIAGPQNPVVENAADLSLTDNEKRSYSLVNAIRAQVTGNWKEAGFERSCSEAIAKRTGKDTPGFFMPMNITMDRAAYAVGTAGSGTTGGTLVATNLLSGSFIELLRNKARVVQLGAQMLSGLTGNVDIPRQTAATSTYWVAEAGDVTQAEGTFDKISLSPKTLGARSQMSRLMMMQSTPDIEVLVRNDLATQIALGIDLAAISGTGASNQPRGILNTSGIGSVVGGTNGAAITIDQLIDLETAVTNANGPDTNLAYLTNAKAVGALKKLKSTTGQYLWTGSSVGAQSGTPGEINGYPVARSNQVSSTGTKGTSSGVCSTVIYGAWNELIIGEFGVLEVLANPYGTGFNSGSIDIRALQSVDIAVRHAASFSAITDALTA
jgi:HK97 family phage major capsid protein/HK97 family phage prohead protease